MFLSERIKRFLFDLRNSAPVLNSSAALLILHGSLISVLILSPQQVLTSKLKMIKEGRLFSSVDTKFH